MSSVLTRKAKVLFLSVGNFLTTISSLLLTIALTRIFTIGQYADYKQTLLVFLIFSPILLFGLDKSIYYFFVKKETNRRNDYLNIQLFLLFVNIVYVLFFVFGGDTFFSIQFNNPKLKELLLLYSVISLFEIPTKLITPVLVITEKVKKLTLFNIFYKLLYFIVSVSLAYLYRDVKMVLISQVLLAIVAAAVSQTLIFKELAFLQKFKFDLSIIKKYLWIGIPLSAATILGFLGKNIDKALISRYLTKEEFAFYVNGAIEVPLIASITGAIMTILLGDFAILYTKKNYGEIFRLWSKSIKITSSILILMMFGLLLNAETLITLMYGEAYIESTKPFVIYLLLIPTRAMIFSNLITITSQTKYILYGSFFYLIFNVVFSVVLIKTMGFVGPAVATVISTYLLNMYFSIVIKKHYEVSFFKVFNFFI